MYGIYKFLTKIMKSAQKIILNYIVYYYKKEVIFIRAKACSVKRNENESFESLLKRFKKSVEKCGVLIDYKKHEYHEAPSLKAKRKHENAIKRLKKEERLKEKFYMRNSL